MGTITTARQDVATLLDAAPTLSAVAVWPHRQNVLGPTQHTLILGTGQVEPAPVAAFGRVVRLELWLVSPATEYGSSDDDLDDVLDLVLAVLDGARVEWISAKPAVWQDTNPAYLIEIEV